MPPFYIRPLINFCRRIVIDLLLLILNLPILVLKRQRIRERGNIRRQIIIVIVKTPLPSIPPSLTIRRWRRMEYLSGSICRLSSRDHIFSVIGIIFGERLWKIVGLRKCPIRHLGCFKICSHILPSKMEWCCDPVCKFMAMRCIVIHILKSGIHCHLMNIIIFHQQQHG